MLSNKNIGSILFSQNYIALNAALSGPCTGLYHEKINVQWEPVQKFIPFVKIQIMGTKV